METEQHKNQLDIKDVEILKNAIHKNVKVGLMPENFDQFILSQQVYVDKSLYLKQIIDKGHFFITAPHGWGKSLNLSMIKTFLQPDWDNDAYYNEKNQFDFTKAKRGEVLVNGEIVKLQPLKIANEKEFFKFNQGKHPVIMLNLKSVTNFDTFEEMKSKIILELEKIYQEYQNIYKKRLLEIWNFSKQPFIKKYGSLNSIDLIHIQYLITINEIELQEEDKEMVAYFTQQFTQQYRIEYSLEYLANLLYQIYNRQVYILVDEFDTPVHSLLTRYIESMGDEQNFKQIQDLILKVSEFITTLITNVFNHSIYFKVILTGIINSINKMSSDYAFRIYELGILSKPNIFSEFFGFQENEIDEIIEKVFDPKQDIKVQKNNLKEKLQFWYNGYNVSKKQMYNPFSIMSYFSKLILDQQPQFESFWEACFTKHIITPILQQALKNEIDLSKYLNTFVLMSKGIQQNLNIDNGSIITIIQDFVNYPNVLQYYPKLFNNILLKTGYLNEMKSLKYVSYYQIPVYEIKTTIQNEVDSVWFQKLKIQEFKFEFIKIANQIDFYENTSDQIEQYLEKLVSIVKRNTHINQNVCQSVLLMAFVYQKFCQRNQYKVQYDFYSRKGRLDICFYFEDRADIIEIIFEHTANNQKVDQIINETLEQIKDSQYDSKVKETIEIYKKNIKCVRFVPMIFYTRENDEKIYCKIGQTIDKLLNEACKRNEQIENFIEQDTNIENFYQDSKDKPQIPHNQKEKMTQNVIKSDREINKQSKRGKLE